VIKGFMEDAEHQEAQLDDDEDDETLKQKNLIDKYKSYLERLLKQTKVLARNEEMTAPRYQPSYRAAKHKTYRRHFTHPPRITWSG
jgi:hypothetical protein